MILNEGLGPAIRLVGWGDETVELANKKNIKAPNFGNPALGLAAFVALREMQNSRGVLSALEKAVKPSMSVSDRSALLVSVGAFVEENMVKRPKSARVEN